MWIDAARRPHPLNERGIFAQRGSAELEQGFIAHALRIRRQHSGPGPRGRARRLATIVYAYRRATLRKVEGNCKADEPGADYNDVAATVIHRKQRFDAARGSPALRPLPTCRCRRDPRRLAGEPK